MRYRRLGGAGLEVSVIGLGTWQFGGEWGQDFSQREVDALVGRAGELEDILEEIVGEIEGEYDLPDDTLTRVDEHTLLVSGSMTIDDFNEAVGTGLPQSGARTMAGLVFNALARRPEPGDTVSVDAARLTVEEMDGMRISRLRVDLTPSPPPA